MSCPKLVLQGLSWSDPSLFVLWRFWHNSLVSCVECFSPSKSQNDKIRKKIKKICSCCECQLPLSSEWMVALLFLTTFSFKSTFNFNWYIFFPRTFWVKVSFLFKIPQIPAPTFFIILLQNKETFKSVIHQS